MNNNYFNEIKNRVIEKIKQIIPKDSLDNFENNLQSLNLVFDEPESQEDFLDNSDMDKGFNPHYDSINNSVVFCKQYLKLLYQESLHTDNPREYYYSNIQETLFHELIHVASTKIDNDYLSGFDTHNKDGFIGNNIGLTEGYVDYIVRKNYFNKSKLPFTGYKELVNIVAQLELLIGEDKLKDIYFNNKGINKLAEELEKYNIDKTSSEALFLRIQDYYDNNYKEGSKNNLIGNINHNLNMILISKINSMKDENVSKEELNKLLDNYEQNFISVDLLKAYNRDINNYELIEESLDELKEIKEDTLSSYYGVN